MNVRRVSAFGGVMLASGLVFGAPGNGFEAAAQTTANTLSDAQIESNVLRALASDPQLSNQNIQSATVYGVVTLTGSVRTEPMRVSAENLVARAQGVQKVVDEMVISNTAVAAAGQGVPAQAGAGVATAAAQPYPQQASVAQAQQPAQGQLYSSLPNSAQGSSQQASAAQANVAQAQVQQYPEQQAYPGQQYPAQPNPGQPAAEPGQIQQQYPAQGYPSQSTLSQPSQGQPAAQPQQIQQYPAQQYPGQPAPAQQYPGQPAATPGQVQPNAGQGYPAQQYPSQPGQGQPYSAQPSGTPNVAPGAVPGVAPGVAPGQGQPYAGQGYPAQTQPGQAAQAQSQAQVQAQPGQGYTPAAPPAGGAPAEAAGRQPLYPGYAPASPAASNEGGQVAGIPVTVAGGAMLRVRINRGLDSNHVSIGEAFDGTVMTDVVAGDEVAIPRGATVTGVVVGAHKAGLFKGEGELSLQLNSVTLGGRVYPLTSLVWAHTGADKLPGTISSSVGLGAVGALMGGAFGGGVGAAVGAAAGAGAGMASSAAVPRGALVIPPEAVLTFRIAASVRVMTVSEAEMERLSYQAGPPPQAPPPQGPPGYYSPYGAYYGPM